MDWRHNQWVGVGAAVLLVVGIVFVFFWTGRKNSAIAESRKYFYLCDSTGETFTKTEKDMENDENAEKYLVEAGSPAYCDICGQDDAHQAYYCPECQKWYAYTRSQMSASTLYCPKKHIIPNEWQ